MGDPQQKWQPLFSQVLSCYDSRRPTSWVLGSVVADKAVAASWILGNPLDVCVGDKGPGIIIFRYHVLSREGTKKKCNTRLIDGQPKLSLLVFWLQLCSWLASRKLLLLCVIMRKNRPKYYRLSRGLNRYILLLS